MIDFVEYVVAELANKRLSKSDAISLIRQFQSRSKADPRDFHIHPLLHNNFSDLYQQSYSSRLDGSEFFLRDHVVNGKKVLPGVAYLEMARIAIATALSPEPDEAIELRNVVWAQPIAVSAPTDVSIALFVDDARTDGTQIDYEVSSLQVDAADGASETVHSRGFALIAKAGAPRQLDLGQLAGQMRRGRIEAPELYAIYEKLGISYGPAHRAVTSIEQGEHQLLAHLVLPDSVADTLGDYLLHPSIMDAAVQSALGFIEDKNAPNQLRLPFALESLRIVSGCTQNMVAWLRYSAGSSAGDAITKLDIDLCDTQGNVCIQMQGFTSRVLSQETAVKPLFATPAWEAKAIDAAAANPVQYSARHIVLCGLAGIDGARLEAAIPGSACLSLPHDARKDMATRYREAAVACFERIKSILEGKMQGQVLVQVAVAGTAEQETMLGLSGLLKSASRENPALVGQVIVTDPKSNADQLARQLQQDAGRAQDEVIKYDGQGSRHVLALRELEAAGEAPAIAFKDRGVYLITGGLGGLGMLFAKEILERCNDATVVLTGRGALAADKQALLASLASKSGVAVYRQLDLADAGQTRAVVSAIVGEYGRLDGIIHAAGMLADSFILKKSRAQFVQVLEPKVAGTVNLDEATKDIDLDFLMLFSAGAAITGNVGQADYAAANGFMDRFAAYRNELLSLGQRKGKTRSINWPLWEEGGMGTDAATKEQLKRSFGMYPLQTATGLQAFHRSLAWPYGQLQIAEGELGRLRETLFAEKSVAPASAPAPALAPAPAAQPVQPKQSAGKAEQGNVQEKAQNYLKKQLSQVLKLPVNKIEAAAPFEKYGIDSIMMMDLTNELEKSFGSLPKTLFFEYQSIAELARYFIKSHQERMTELLGPSSTASAEAPAAPASAPSPAPAPVPASAPVKLSSNKRGRRLRHMSAGVQVSGGAGAAYTGPIAIVGLSGRYPSSPNIETYWQNLRDGKDCVTEVPKERWDWQKYYTEDRSKPGMHYSKWGGFIEGVDEFDPLFFNISPREARTVDPQERLFLQHAWMAMEDAGYTRSSLQIPRQDGQSGMVGVYVGVMYGEYNLSGSLASIANRVSYVLNVHGPSMTLDTMCSSSLTAIHLACQDLKQGRTDVGIAGGVNVSIHPSKYLLLSAGQFISSDGHCQSFGEGGDGYIPGEGVGAVVLKRLADAERDGDHIHGTIKGSALNHGGKTNGYTVPNPHAQAKVIRQALADANTDPRHISYIEAHGTGTKLGDPIEILALSNAFYHDAKDKEFQFCALGSAKSNIGHCESAAGIAGITKILLQMKHQQIVPSLHSTRLNPNIDFDHSPFVVNQTLRAWDRPVVAGRQLPRIAGISSFGAGGSNAHIVIEEYVAQAAPAQAPDAQFIVPLSARTKDQLKQKARDLLAFLPACNAGLASIAYTLQVGREAMEERLGFVSGSIEQLSEQLKSYLKGDQEIDGGAQGQAKRNNDTLSLFSDDADLQETVDKWIARKNLGKLLDLWVRGMDLGWSKLYGDALPKRASLPTYPFAKEKYWIETVGQVVQDAVAGSAASAAAVSAAVLHPLVHRNTSNLEQQSYSSRFKGDEWFLRSSQALPAMLFLEMARVAVEAASPVRQESSMLELSNVAWGQPFGIASGQEVNIALFAENGLVDFDIYSAGKGPELVHCQGQARFSRQNAPSSIAIAPLKQRMGAELNLATLQIGPVHPGIAAIYKGQNELLVQLSLRPEGDGEGAWLLHPATLACVLQAAGILVGNAIPVSLDSVRVVFGCVKEMMVWVRVGQGGQLDIDLCDLQGTVCVQMRGLSLRQLVLEQAMPAQAAPRQAAPAAVKRPAVVLATTDDRSAASVAVPAKPRSIQLLAPGESHAVDAGQSGAKRASVRLMGLQDVALPVPAAAPQPAAVVLHKPVEQETRPAVEWAQDISREQLMHQLKASLAEALYMSASDIDAGKPFVELGLDSIVGVEWIKAINKQYGLNLSATKVYDYPNIEALASLIADEIAARPAGETPVAAAPAAPAPAPAEPLPVVSLQALDAGIPEEDVVDHAVPSVSPRTAISKEELLLQLKASLAEALYMNASDIDVGKPFVELGLDSIVGVEWIKAINKQYGLNLSATKVYDYPNIEALAALVADEMAASPVVEAAAAAPAPVRAAAPASVSLQPVAAPAPARTASVSLQALDDGAVEDDVPAALPRSAVSREELLLQLKASLAEALYMNSSDIDASKPFVELGLDSIVGVEWIKVINKQYGLNLSATKVYDYPNIEALAALIADEMAASPAAAAAAVVPAPAPAPVRATASVSLQTLDAGVEDEVPAAAPQAAISREELLLQLKASLAEALYMNSSDIDVSKPFVELGLDSIVGVEWIKAINKQYGLNLSATKVYDYPNIEVLAALVADEMAANPALAAVAAPAPAPAPARATATASVSLQALDAGVEDDAPAAQSAISREELLPQLRASLAEALYMEASDIDISKPFVELGLDSIVGVEWIKVINKQYGLNVSATKVYDYPNIEALAAMLADEMSKLPGAVKPAAARPKAPAAPAPAVTAAKPQALAPAPAPARATATSYPVLKRKVRPGRVAVQSVAAPAPASQVTPVATPVAAPAAEKIAIIGMSGRYPQAKNLREFWDNLAQGKNAVVEVPPSRWDVDQYFDPVPGTKGKVYCKWLGMVDDADCFDPLFFQISPAEAESMDPQHRLFMQEAYRAFEDAGYSNKTLSNKKCGVYLGIMNNEYSLMLAKTGSTTVDATGTSYAIGSARIAYYLNLKGPAIPIDTACSSSLVGIHLGCQALLNGEIDMALVGGSTLYLTPDSYLGMCQAGMLSPDGQCKAFDNNANGFVPGEGAGAVVLKRLKDAEADNDHIYGVILGSAINQDGKTNGITAPSVNSQIELERQLYAKCNIDPETITYVETHGTGTKLGDPIELEALSTVFSEKTKKKNYCALGSVKSNVGHTSAAAGVASVQKVLLSMRHRTLVPTLHVAKENALFDFGNSPFYISREKQAWKPAPNSLLRAAVSSFGFSGTNAHLVIEEYAPARAQAGAAPVKGVEAAVLLSARTQEQLGQKVRDLLDFVQRERAFGDLDLTSMAYTLQVGREAFKERLGFVATTIDQLTEQLQGVVSGAKNLAGVYQGQTGRDKESLSLFITDPDLRETLNKWITSKKLPSLTDLWVKGLDIDWSRVYASQAKPKRMSLPTYPFAMERYWITLPAASAADKPKVAAAPKALPAQPAATQPAAKAVEAKEKAYYAPSWNARALAAAGGASQAPTLVFDAGNELFQALGKRFGAQQPSIVLVTPGDAYAQIAPNVFTIDVGREEHFHQLVEDLKARDMAPRQVVHHCLQPQTDGADDGLALRLNQGVLALFYLCKALMAQKQALRTRILSVFASTPEQRLPEYAALGAFFKSLTLENPNFVGKIVDVRASGTAAGLEDTVDLIAAELNDEQWNAVDVRYEQQAQDGKSAYVRYAREISRFRPDASSMAELPVKQSGVYLITGGLGGLGFIFAEYLVKNFNARLALVGRSAPSQAQQDLLGRLTAHHNDIVYLQGDVCKPGDMERVVAETKARFSQINGVIHSAGVIRDAFILKKTREEMESVMASKVYGAINLDRACAGENLDLFVLFSSIAGTLGNLGQCDYAFANRFLDAFAENREALRGQQQRAGKTMSISWPLWTEGGMSISEQDIARSEAQLGISPLPTREGIESWEDLLRSPLAQGVPLYGVATRIDAYFASSQGRKQTEGARKAQVADTNVSQEDTENYLRKLIGLEIKLAPELIDPQEPFDSFGIDSIVVGRLNTSLTADLGELPKTLFYEYQTIEELAKYLLEAAREPLARLLGAGDASPAVQVEDDVAQVAQEVAQEGAPEVREDAHRGEAPGLEAGPVAIIGIHGIFPRSADLNQYWEHLKQGHDLVDLVPQDRWDYNEYYDADPEKAAGGKIYCKWGGFIEDVDKFDADFFNIPAGEAKLIDPQERLFLQSVWSAFEEAGYTRDSLRQRHPKGKSADVGVFVGVTTNSYHLLQADEWDRGNMVSPSSLPWSIANRVSYFFDFQGPSMPVDTACSSCLVAMHLACESLSKQECQVAVAGGVNLYLHPAKYHSFCQRGMLALNGRTRSYGAGDDGFVPAEAVGSLVLKPLDRAIADGDHIHAVIAGSAVEHGGRSNGYSAPNPQSQASIIGRALDAAGVHPETISYVEGHGTGTQLGDNLEITALTHAFRPHTAKKQFCAVGSVKANMGHPESAAGIAAVSKVILQMKHRQLAPTLNSNEVNPNIAFGDSPFYLQHALGPWESPAHPRRSLINSFGAGGVNACMVLEEYVAPASPAQPAALAPQLIVLSAKNADRLAQRVEQLLGLLELDAGLDLASLSYTLQVGREAMPARLAVIAADGAELIAKLRNADNPSASQGIYRGSLEARRAKRAAKNKDDVLQPLYESRDLRQLAERWIAGDEVEWERLYSGARPMRMSLPTYPFAKERHWLSDNVATMAGKSSGPSQAVLHPLISYNSSTLSEVTFSSWLSANEFYAQDHKVNGQPMFPGSGYLEIACVSGAIAGGKKVRKLRDIVWIQPLVFQEASQLVQISLQSAQDSVEYMVTSFAGGQQKVVHSEGILYFEDAALESGAKDERLSPADLKQGSATQLDPEHYYSLFEQTGIVYGPAFRTMQELYVGPSYALSRLSLVDHLRANFEEFVLHPSIIDGALQTVSALVGQGESATPFLPFAIDEVEIVRPMSPNCFVYVEHSEGTAAGNGDVMKFNIKIINATGHVLVNIRNFCVRAFGGSTQDGGANGDMEASISK